MLKNLSLTAILSDAANREDVERQAKEMEQMSLKPETVKRFMKSGDLSARNSNLIRLAFNSAKPSQNVTKLKPGTLQGTATTVEDATVDHVATVQHQAKCATTVNAEDILPRSVAAENTASRCTKFRVQLQIATQMVTLYSASVAMDNTGQLWKWW